MKNTLKTLISIMLVFSMIMSLGVVVSASTYETPSKTFYLSINDFATIMGAAVLNFDDIVVFAQREDLLDAEGDKELITYYRDKLSIY